MFELTYYTKSLTQENLTGAISARGQEKEVTSTKEVLCQGS